MRFLRRNNNPLIYGRRAQAGARHVFHDQIQKTFRSHAPRQSRAAPATQGERPAPRSKGVRLYAPTAPTRGCFLGAHPPKQVLAPTGRNSFLFPQTTCRSCFMGAREGGWWGSEARLRGHHRRQECRRSVGWATLLSPLVHGSLPTKTSFGPDGKKPLSRPPSATGVSPVRRMGDTLVAPAAWEPPHQNGIFGRDRKKLRARGRRSCVQVSGSFLEASYPSSQHGCFF